MSFKIQGSRAAVLAVAILFLRPGFGAPALTTIQDILYKADGTRFNGTVTIAWTNFQTSDSSTVATQALTVPVVNGFLRTQLVPTTTASPGAQYSVTYASQGKYQFSEIWAVPQSSTALRIRDVRVSTGTVVGPPAVTTSVLISDVTGLADELTQRVTKGTAFGPNRVAVVNSSGLLDGVTGNATDCIHVDGSSGACGTAGSSGGAVLVTFVDLETPAGLVDGANSGYSLVRAPNPLSSLKVFRNGLMMTPGVDYSLSGRTMTFVAAAVPQPGDVLQASYRTGDPTNPLGAFTTAEVVCNGVGGSTTSTVQVELGSCTIPAGVLSTGDRVDVRAELAHSGTTGTFASVVKWGSTTIGSASGASGDSRLSLTGSVAVDSTGSLATMQVLKGTPVVQLTTATDAINAAVRLSFSGLAAGGPSDSLSLRNFTVLRYPVQTNP